MTVSKYEILTATTANGLQAQVNAKLPSMQPVGGVTAYGRHVLQPMVETGGAVAVTDGQKIDGVAIGDDTGSVTFTVEDGEITGITLDIDEP